MAFSGRFRRMTPGLEVMHCKEGSLFNYTSGIGDGGLRWTLQADDLRLEMMRCREGSLFNYTSGIGDGGLRWTLQANDSAAGGDALKGRQCVQLYQWYRRSWTSLDLLAEV